MVTPKRLSGITREAPNGFVFIDKPQGISSHDVVSRMRYHLGTKKVGHAGTLDPMATGLMVVGVGVGTKLLTYAVGLDKVYDATIRLGCATITDDAEGDFVGERAGASALDALTVERIAGALPSGEMMQVPSSVSAIKVNGVRSYARVRSGDEVALAPRPVTIMRADIHEVRRVPGEGTADAGWIDVDVTVACTSGTYIRAIARDLGTALGVGGHLSRLRRTEVGAWSVGQAHALPTRDAPRAEEDPDRAVPVLPLARAAAQLLPVAALTEREATALRYGQWLDPAAGAHALPAAAIHVPSEDLVAIVEESSKPPLVKPAVVFPAQG